MTCCFNDTISVLGVFMDGLCELKGQVLDGAGRPVSGVVIHADHRGDDDRFVQVTHEDGSFDFERLPPGSYALACDKEGMKHLAVEVALTAGGLEDLRLTMEPAADPNR